MFDDRQPELNRLRGEINLARVVADSVPAMLAYWDADQRCRFANRAYETWFGVSPEALIGQTMEDLLGPIYPQNLPFILGVLGGTPQAFDREIPDPGGGPPRYSHADYIPHVVDGEVRGFVVLVTDISDRRRLEEDLRKAKEEAESLATRDALTGLPNRVLLADRISRALAEGQRESQHVGILFVDLDGFKYVNDHYGHGVGDDLLRQVARRLESVLRESDSVTRLGGDEFIVVLPGLPSSEQVGMAAQGLLDRMAGQPFVVAGRPVEVSFSVGVAIFPDDGVTGEALLGAADAALGDAKRAGKNRWSAHSNIRFPREEEAPLER
jgi:diguanylate cyclase (GGDEF)-like protein/PAS domain S-box-containing protein